MVVLTIPEGAENVAVTMMEDPEAESPLVQVNFTLDGMDFIARAQNNTEEKYIDGIGMYYDWTVQEEKELKPIRNSKIYAFFPTAKEAHQNFYIHAPFDTTPARDNFKEGAEYGKHNIKLVRNIGNLICFAFCWMRDHHYLSVSGFRNVFPIYEYEEDDVLYPLYENSIDMIREEAILPTSNPGEFKNLKDICVPLWSVIVDSFDTDDLRRLMRRRNLNWIAKEFTTEAYRDLLAFLKVNFTLEILDWKDLVMQLDTAFLQEKTLSWMDRLLPRIEGYCTKRSSSDSHYINVSRIPFVRTTDQKQVCARSC